MRIGVIADTHIPRAADKLPRRVYELFAAVDLILHAGDLVEWSVMEQLAKIAPVEAVSGNMDSPMVLNRLPAKKIIRVGEVKIGLIHGSGTPAGLEERVRRAFINEDVRIIVFGHSHSPLNETKEGKFLLNPGSPTDKVFASVNSVGILEVSSRDVRAEIIRI